MKFLTDEQPVNRRRYRFIAEETPAVPALVPPPTPSPPSLWAEAAPSSPPAPSLWEKFKRPFIQAAEQLQWQKAHPITQEELTQRIGRLAAQPGEKPGLSLRNIERAVARSMAETAFLTPLSAPRPETGVKGVDVAANILGTGLGFIAPMGAGGSTFKMTGPAMLTPKMAAAPTRIAETLTPLAERIAPTAPRGLAPRISSEIIPVAERLTRGATAGGIYGAMRGTVEGQSPADIPKAALEDAALFAAMDVILPGAGRMIAESAPAQPLARAATEVWQRLRSMPKPGVPIITPLPSLRSPPLAPPAEPGAGKIYRPVSWKPGPTARPVPIAPKEIPRPVPAEPGINAEIRRAYKEIEDELVARTGLEAGRGQDISANEIARKVAKNLNTSLGQAKKVIAEHLASQAGKLEESGIYPGSASAGVKGIPLTAEQQKVLGRVSIGSIRIGQPKVAAAGLPASPARFAAGGQQAGALPEPPTGLRAPEAKPIKPVPIEERTFEDVGSRKIEGYKLPPNPDYIRARESIAPGTGKARLSDSPSERATPLQGRPDGQAGKVEQMAAGPKPSADLKLPSESVESAAREMGQKINETIGEVRPPMGLSIKLIKSPAGPPGKRFTFSDSVIEERFEAAKGVRDVPLLIRARDMIYDIARKATREYEHLPRNAEFARLRTDLLRLSKQKGVKSDETLRLMQGITINLDKGKYDLFRRQVILADLAEEAKAGHDLPFGFTPKTLNQESQNLRQAIGSDPDILRALDDRKKVWQAIKDEYAKAMQEIGYDVSEKLTRKEYYRHQVLEYARLKSLYGTGQKLKTPTGRGFLQKREGSELDINTDYLQAEYEVMAQMLYDTEVAKTIKNVDLHYNIADKIKAEAKQKGVDWRSLIPDGYTTWQPRQGNIFYLADSIPARLAEQLYNKALTEIGIAEDQLRKVLAVGGKRTEFVAKEEVAKTLDNLTQPAQDDLMHRLFSVPLNWWKQWQLLSPRRWFKYNARNLSGDAEAVFIGNPSAFQKLPQAASELYQVFAGDKAMTPEMRAWFERGGMQTLLQAQELGEINKLRMFLRLAERKGTPAEYPLKAVQSYWKMARLSTDFREALLRYSSYLDYLNQIQKSGRPKNFGASIPEEVMALGDPRDMAFKLSNDLLGAYDQVSIIGQGLRKYLIPFWSWQEVNFRRSVQLMKNAARDEKLAQMAGRKLAGIAIRSPFIAYRIGTFALKATALWTALQTWNNLRFPKEEKELGIHVRSRPHIIFGRDQDGKIIYFDRLGAIQDFVSWFGLDEAPLLVSDWLNGKRTLKEITQDMAKSVVSIKAVQGIGPHIKMPVEMLLGRKLYPDVFKTIPIRDRWEHLADSLALGEEYRQLAGKPVRPYGESLSQFFAYKADPSQSSYYDIQEEKRRYMKKIGKLGEGYFITPKGNALYNFKLAVRYKDRQAAVKYLTEYAALGGTKEGLQRSMQSMHPLYGLNRQEQIAFVQSLRPEDQERLIQAMQYYETVLR